MSIFTPELITNFGLTGGLFVGLLIYVLKENKAREEQYRETIKHLTEILNSTLTELSCDVTEIKEKMDKFIKKH